MSGFPYPLSVDLACCDVSFGVALTSMFNAAVTTAPLTAVTSRQFIGKTIVCYQKRRLPSKKSILCVAKSDSREPVYFE
jgi:hypothetical protein